MKFSKALPILLSELQSHQIEHALVGGLALSVLGAARTTFDADFMILLNQADQVDQIMKKIGYEALHKTQDVANYKSSDPDMGQVDFLFAHRRYALSMLKRARPVSLLGHSVKVIQPEDLIGLKVQSGSNDPDRTLQDNADIEDILRKHHATLDWTLIEGYFRLFDREAEFKALSRKFR
jgi:predicted nucleotidyltransferase